MKKEYDEEEDFNEEEEARLDELQEKLDEFNKRIEDIFEERTKFLDENMHLIAEFQIGDEVVNVTNGQKTKVVKHYRGVGNQSQEYDDQLVCYCSFINERNIGDNTSHYGYYHPYVLVYDYENKTQKYIKALEHMARNSGR